jgi:putative ABC transport system substrate-binding protein
MSAISRLALSWRAPKIISIGLLVNPNNPNAAVQTKEMQAETTAFGLHLQVLSAGSQSDFDNTFAALVQQRLDALVVSADPFFFSHRDQLVALAMRHSMPAVYYAREFVAAGGLISYASSFGDSFRQAATYVGRILKGEKPADLPGTAAHQVRNSLSTSRPQRRLASTFHQRCSRAPMR